jgi:hypothetical protein
MEQNQSTAVTNSIEPSKATIEQCAAFINGVFAQTNKGRHVMTISTARGVENVLFSKDWDDKIAIDSDNHRVLYETVLVALELDKVLGVTLRSISGAANPHAEPEAYGWVVTSFSIRGLKAAEVREAYSEVQPGDELDYVTYKDGWRIRSAVKK